jgi:hypothetical protein
VWTNSGWRVAGWAPSGRDRRRAPQWKNLCTSRAPLIDHYRRNDLYTYLDACILQLWRWQWGVDLGRGAPCGAICGLGISFRNSLSDHKSASWPAPLTWFSGGHVTRGSAVYQISAFSGAPTVTLGILALDRARLHLDRHTIAHRVGRYRGCGSTARRCLGTCWKTRMALAGRCWLDTPRNWASVEQGDPAWRWRACGSH